jgi:hypothetical protein
LNIVRISGTSVRDIAHQFGLSITDVNAVIDRKMIKLDNAYRVRAVALDLERLEEMQKGFLRQALEGDATAGHLVIKIAERRAAILGTDAPIRIDAVKLVEANGPRQTTTEEWQAAIDRLCASPKPQSN